MQSAVQHLMTIVALFQTTLDIHGHSEKPRNLHPCYRCLGVESNKKRHEYHNYNVLDMCQSTDASIGYCPSPRSPQRDKELPELLASINIPTLGSLGGANLSSEIGDQLRLMGTNERVSIFTSRWRTQQFPRVTFVYTEQTEDQGNITSCTTACYSHDTPKLKWLSLPTRHLMLRRNALHRQVLLEQYISPLRVIFLFLSAQPILVLVDDAVLLSSIIICIQIYITRGW